MNTASVALPARTLARIRVLRRRLVVMIVLGAGLFALYTFWFRDSSLVAVKTVEVKGAGAGDDATRLKRELTVAAEEMTTLNVSQADLVAAARPFPLVREVKADPSFPSSLTIEVVERRPIALIGPGPVAVAGDGRILRGVPAKGLPLPSLPLAEAPEGSWVGGSVGEQAKLLGAVPPALLRYVDHTFKGPSGIGVELDGGVDLLFSTAARAAQKWRAAVAVLGDPKLGPLDYVDLTVPRRPAVGGVSYEPPSIPSS